TLELVHWHGQIIPSDVDGAAKEGTPYIQPHGMRRIAFVPKPAGFRFYHTHVVAGGDLNRGTYTWSGRVGIHRAKERTRSLRPRGLALRCRATRSGSSRSTGIPCRRRGTCR